MFIAGLELHLDDLVKSGKAAVLLAPIAFNTANDLEISPYPLMMVVAISAAAAVRSSFLF